MGKLIGEFREPNRKDKVTRFPFVSYKLGNKNSKSGSCHQIDLFTKMAAILN